MKAPRPFIAAKSPVRVPIGGNAQRMLQKWGVGAFAFHPPSIGEDRHEAPPRMKRPRGGHGPHNPME